LHLDALILHVALLFVVVDVLVYLLEVLYFCGNNRLLFDDSRKVLRTGNQSVLLVFPSQVCSFVAVLSQTEFLDVVFGVNVSWEDALKSLVRTESLFIPNAVLFSLLI
jgi:hypothetical protein